MTTTAPVDAASTDHSLAYLLGRVALLEVAVRQAVARRGDGDPDPADPLRGVYLSDDYVSWLLDRVTAAPPDAADAGLAAMAEQLDRDADGAQARGADVRLRRLTRDFRLGPAEEALLVVALAPMLDRRFGQLFGYLNDDVTRRYATVSLAVELATGRHPGDPRRWLLLSSGAPLVADGLVEVTEPDLPLPARPVRVAERVLAFLLGDDTPDPVLDEHLVEVEPLPVVDPAFAELAPQPVLVHQQAGTDAAVEAATWLAAHGPAPLVARLPAAEAPGSPDVVALLARECRLLGRPLVAGPVDGSSAGALRGLQRVLRRLPAVALWSEGDARAAGVDPVLAEVDLAVPPVAHRAAAWQRLCADLDVPDGDLALLAARHRIGAGPIRRAVDVARRSVSGTGEALDRAALEGGVRAQDGAALQGQARRIRPTRTWDDLVLPEGIRRKLRELVAMVRHRDELVDSWGLGRGGAARGVSALFAGGSGTGKTLAAEVVAHELGVDLYTVDLARVVDKYVGETEKNLDRVLTAAEGVTGVIFFDEADALFGRRGEVRHGQDRYANLEVSFLLQRVEAMGAVVVLATNLRSQVDDAFIRRLDCLVEFATPDAAGREAIWRRHLRRLALAGDVDVPFCAATFELSGGGIRNAVAAAACFAADAGRPVAMRDLVRGLEREYEKLGRLRVPADFGRYADLLGSAP